jgi:2-methylcitrate dehydratase PrpD
VLINRNASADSFSDEIVSNPRITHLASLVTVKENEQYTSMLPDRRPATVTVELKNGSVLTETVDSAKGDQDNPYTKEEIEKKFRDLAGGIAGKNTNQIIQLIDNLDGLASIKELTGLLGSQTN